MNKNLNKRSIPRDDPKRVKSPKQPIRNNINMLPSAAIPHGKKSSKSYLGTPDKVGHHLKTDSSVVSITRDITPIYSQAKPKSGVRRANARSTSGSNYNSQKDFGSHNFKIQAPITK
jgi:hypothetical protein